MPERLQLAATYFLILSVLLFTCVRTSPITAADTGNSLTKSSHTQRQFTPDEGICFVPLLAFIALVFLAERRAQSFVDVPAFTRLTWGRYFNLPPPLV
jgi:hypothetical protein